MRPIRMIARPLLAAPFIKSGIEALRDPGSRAEQVAPTVKPLADRYTWLPNDPELLVRIQGAVNVGAGVLLALGRLQRLSALALALNTLPHALAPGAEDRAPDRSERLTELAKAGALLMIATEPIRRKSALRPKARVQALEARHALDAQTRKLERRARRMAARAARTQLRMAAKAGRAKGAAAARTRPLRARISR
ncbi:DoxX family protein [Bailinhaonella thermotolerans]|uniref:DoxX family protein n=1 Tax=Bailinhaonella thermotolerans TaxID=1070861 RepID=UPI001F5BF78E|nr:DoxX family protein [Bailinhaonella thermotolerans]